MKPKVLIWIVVVCLVLTAIAGVAVIFLRRGSRDQRLYNTARLAWRDGRTTRAISLLKSAILANPKNVDAHKLYIQALIRGKTFSELSGAFKSAREGGVPERDLKLLEVVMLQRKAESTLEAKGSQYTDVTCDEIVQGNLQAAIDILIALTEKDPTDAEAFEVLGTIYRGVGNVLNAKQSYVARQRLTNLKTRKKAEAEKRLVQIRAIMGEISKVNVKAINAYLAASKIAPDKAEPRLALAGLYLQRFRPRLEDARAILEPFLKDNPGHGRANFVMAIVEGMEENDDKALELLLKIVDDKDVGILAQVRAAALMLEAGRIDEADEMTARLMTRRTIDRDAKFVRAKVLLKKEQPDEALPLLQDIFVSQRAHWPQARFVLAKLLISQGQKQQGDDALRDTIRDCQTSVPTTAALRSELIMLRHDACLMLSRQVRGQNTIEAERNAAAALRLLPTSKEAFALVKELALGSQPRKDMDWAIILHGESFLALREFDKAVEVFRKGRPYMQSKNRADTRIATAFARKGDFVEAIAVFEELLKAGPENPKKIELQLADVHAKLGRLDKAEAIYRKLLKAEPGAGDLTSLLVDVLVRSGKIEEARAILTEAGAADERAIQLGIPLVALHLRGGDARGALDVIKKQLTKRPGESRLWVLSAFLHWNMGDRAKAREAFDKALAIKSHDKSACRRVLLDISDGKFNEALALCDSRLTEAPDDLTLVLIQAVAFLGNKSYAQAEKNFGKVEGYLALDERVRLMAGSFRAIVKVAQGRYKAPAPLADADATSPRRRLEMEYTVFLAKLNGLTPDKRHGAVMAYVTLRLMQLFNVVHEGQRQAEILAQIIPDQAIPVFLKALLLDGGGRHEDGLKAYVQLLEMRPDFPFARLRKARSHRAHGEARKEIAVLESMLADEQHQDEDPSLTLISLAAAYGRAGELDKRIEAFRRATKYPRVAAVAHNDLAWILATAKTPKPTAAQFEDALANAKAAVALKKGQPAYLDTLGWIYVVKGEPEKGIPHLENAAARMPGYAVFRYHLGKAYIEAGKVTEGVKELRQALARSEKFAGAEDARALVAKHSVDK
jgi:tetratricopeptide (TPR) repeat protein